MFVVWYLYINFLCKTHTVSVIPIYIFFVECRAPIVYLYIVYAGTLYKVQQPFFTKIQRGIVDRVASCWSCTIIHFWSTSNSIYKIDNVFTIHNHTLFYLIIACILFGQWAGGTLVSLLTIKTVSLLSNYCSLRMTFFFGRWIRERVPYPKSDSTETGIGLL